MLEFDRTEHPIRQAILKQPIEHMRGVVRVPQGPGLGCDPDPSVVMRYRRGETVMTQSTA